MFNELKELSQFFALKAMHILYLQGAKLDASLLNAYLLLSTLSAEDGKGSEY